MNIRKKEIVGLFVLLLILILNLLYATNYYNLESRKLSQFFICQTNIENEK